MKIGLIDVDNQYARKGRIFPNLALMKLSAWHKSQGDHVEWYIPTITGHCDVVYMSKVFSSSPEYDYAVDADNVVKGGSGYAIKIDAEGHEKYNKSMDAELPECVEHAFPDYSLYGITDTAYGYMSRGCPRGCGFCIVKDKEGLKAHKVADVTEFWNGQKFIECFDPNVLACNERDEIFRQLAETKATVNFNQGMDIRLLDDEAMDSMNRVKMKEIHFAWDLMKWGKVIKENLERFAKHTTINKRQVTVFILCGFNTTMEENLERVYYVRSLGFNPYVTLYKKYELPKGHELRRLMRWVNNKWIFRATERFEDYKD